MKIIRLRKGKRLADIASVGLTKRIVPAFDVIGLPCLLTDRTMGFGWKNKRIGLPEIAVRMTTPVSQWNALPEATTGSLTAVTDHKGNHLASTPTKRNPQPAFGLALAHKRPEFIQFELVIGMGSTQCLLYADCSGFFFNQWARV